MEKILFSILIPAYKSKFLFEAIDSCLQQSYKNLEIVIVDDASPENLKIIVDKFNDSRIRYYRNEKNCGALNVVDNWNICLSYAKGDYVICMGDDDKLLPECLLEYNELIEKYPNIGLLHGWTEIINEKSVVTRLTTHRCEYESVISLMWHRLYAYHLQFIGDFCFNRKWLDEQGGFFKLPLAWGSDDISALIGASENGVVNTQNVVFQYRVNTINISNTGNVKEKLKAINSQLSWEMNFLKKIKCNEQDSLYRKELIKDLPQCFKKKKAFTISQDLKQKSLLRILYWFFNRKKFDLDLNILSRALKLYFC